MNRLFTARGDYNNFYTKNGGHLKQGEIFLQTLNKSNEAGVNLNAQGYGLYTPEYFRAGDVYIGNTSQEGTDVPPTLLRGFTLGTTGTNGSYEITLNDISTVKSLYDKIKNYQPGDVLSVKEAVFADSVTEDNEAKYPHKGDLVLVVGDPLRLNDDDADENTISDVIKIIKNGKSEFIKALEDDQNIKGQESFTENYTNALEVLRAMAEQVVRVPQDKDENTSYSSITKSSFTCEKTLNEIIFNDNLIDVGELSIQDKYLTNALANGSLYCNDTSYALPLVKNGSNYNLIYKSTDNGTYPNGSYEDTNDPVTIAAGDTEKWILPGESFLLFRNGIVTKITNSSSTSNGHKIDRLSHGRADTDYDAEKKSISTIGETLAFLEKNKADINPNTRKIYSELLPEALLGTLKYSGTINDDIGLKEALEEDDGGQKFINLINSISGNQGSIIYRINASEYSQNDIEARKNDNGGDDEALLNSGKYYIYNGTAFQIDVNKIQPGYWFNIRGDSDLWIQPGDQLVIDKVTYDSNPTPDASTGKNLYKATGVTLSFVEGADAISSIGVSTTATDTELPGDKFTTFFDSLTFRDYRREANSSAFTDDPNKITTTPKDTGTILETLLQANEKEIIVKSPNATLAFDMPTQEAYAFTYFDDKKIRRVNKYLRFNVGEDNKLLVGRNSSEEQKVWLDKTLNGDLSSQSDSQYFFEIQSGQMATDENQLNNNKNEKGYLRYLKNLLTKADQPWIFSRHSAEDGFNKGEISLPYEYGGPLATITLVMDVAQRLKVLFGRSADSYFDVESGYIPLAVKHQGDNLIGLVNSIFKQSTASNGTIQKITVTSKQTIDPANKYKTEEVSDQDIENGKESSLVFKNTLDAGSDATTEFNTKTAVGNPCARDGKVENVLPNHSGVLLNSNSVIDGGIY